MSFPDKIFPMMVLCSLLLAGCGGVEWQHRHPALKSGEPFALLNEEDKYADNITSSIKGFYENKLTPGAIQEPVMKEYSTGVGVMKTLYTLTPYGLMTLPFADLEGRTIAVPAGELGIAVHRIYYKELSREKIATLKEGDFTMVKSKSYAEAMPMGRVGTVIYRVEFDKLEWDDHLWFRADAGEEYELILSKGVMRDSHGAVVAGGEAAWASIPTGLVPESDAHVVTDGGLVLGKWHVVTVDGKIMVFDKNGDVSAAVISDSDKKDKFTLINPTLTSRDGKDIILSNEAPDGQKAKVIVPSGKGFDAATIICEASNQQLEVNVNRWINKLLETSDARYVDPDLLVTPVLSSMGNYSLTRQDAEMVNRQLEINGVALRVFPSDEGLEATRMVN